MNNTSFASILFAMLFGPAPAMAADGKVTISSPADGATVMAGRKFELSYDAATGDRGDHLHLNVDGKRAEVLRRHKGTVEIDALAPGKHQLCIAVNTKSHVPTGAGSCVNVTAK
jgi:hypothetical protein